MFQSDQGFKHAKTIKKPNGTVGQIIDWCKQESKAKWCWQLVDLSTNDHDGEYIFYFDSDSDYVAFIIKWC